MSSSPEDSPPATPRAHKGSRDTVPPPTGGKTVPEAPAAVAEASSVTKKIPDSGLLAMTRVPSTSRLRALIGYPALDAEDGVYTQNIVYMQICDSEQALVALYT
ncbi:hypothetical protein PC116_g28617 [Phytophthora cactorum]|nr:hypothetical protein PC116_g28617 [Phytophthora cactorum]